MPFIPSSPFTLLAFYIFHLGRYPFPLLAAGPGWPACLCCIEFYLSSLRQPSTFCLTLWSLGSPVRPGDSPANLSHQLEKQANTPLCKPTDVYQGFLPACCHPRPPTIHHSPHKILPTLNSATLPTPTPPPPFSRMGKLHTTKPTHPETPTAAHKQTPTYPSRPTNHQSHCLPCQVTD
jgi:hypothetical protein